MGGQKCIALFNKYLSKQIDLTCVTVKANTDISSEGYPIKNIISDFIFRYINPILFLKLRRIIKQEAITHLILEHPYYGWLGILLKWFCNIKLLVHSHNIEASRFRSIGKWWWGILWNYEKFVHRNASFSFFIQDDDMNYAIQNYHVDSLKCAVTTYGIERTSPPSEADKNAARKAICNTHNINEVERILLFNGTLNYKPNTDAVESILEKINPILLEAEGFKYKIIICGSKLPERFKNLESYKNKNIIYAGFVEDIELYFKGCDIFINPVNDGGGIKTKVVEALGSGMSVVSSKSGAIGIPQQITGQKLVIAEDNDWGGFAADTLAIKTDTVTPAEFFSYFYWGFIAQKAANHIKLLNNKN